MTIKWKMNVKCILLFKSVIYLKHISCYMLVRKYITHNPWWTLIQISGISWQIIDSFWSSWCLVIGSVWSGLQHQLCGGFGQKADNWKSYLKTEDIGTFSILVVLWSILFFKASFEIWNIFVIISEFCIVDRNEQKLLSFVGNDLYRTKYTLFNAIRRNFVRTFNGSNSLSLPKTSF